MTPNEALQWLDRATQGMTGDRAAHMTTIEALNVLRAAIATEPTKPEPRPEAKTPSSPTAKK